MEKYQEKAYRHLTDTEKGLLSLVIVSHKSLLEASNILQISNYKVREYFFRAKRLFVIFAEYYSHFEEFFPPVYIDPLFKEYLTGIFFERKSRATLKTDPKFAVMADSKKHKLYWLELFNMLEYTHTLHALRFKDLILEFDRWNNIRILPKPLQLPSPYGRRKLRFFKKFYQRMFATGELGYDYITQTFGHRGGDGAILAVYSTGIRIIPIKVTARAKDYCSQNQIIIYKNEPTLYQLQEAIEKFQNTKRTIKTASEFWLIFQRFVLRAHNIGAFIGVRDMSFYNEALKEIQIKPTEKPTVRYRLPDPDNLL